MSTNPLIQHHTLSCAGVKLHYVESRPSEYQEGQTPTLVFYHGFPEFWQTWEEQIRYFGEHYRVVAPDLPGYNLSEKPSTADFYQIPNLIEVMSAFLKVISPIEPVTLVGHDWGGVIAWPLAAFHADLVERLVILNAAHPSTFTRELAHNSEQRKKSRYIFDLIASDGVERVSADDFHYLKEMIFGSMAGDPLSPERKAAYLKAWSQPGALEAMLSYYRSMPQLVDADESPTAGVLASAVSAKDLRIPKIRVEVPTLVLWGEDDPAFVTEVLDGLGDYVQDLKVVRYPGQTHWLHHEKPYDVSQEIERFLGYKPQQ